jgi:hypothetical protein
MLIMAFQPSTTFDLTVQCFDTSSTVHFRSSPKDLPDRMSFCLFPQRSPPRLLISAAWGGLRSAPESRPRGAFPHRYHSCELTSLRFLSVKVPSRGTRLKQLLGELFQKKLFYIFINHIYFIIKLYIISSFRKIFS